MLIWSPERIKAYTSGNPGRQYKVLGKVEATGVPSYFSKRSTPELKSYERNFKKYGDTKVHKKSYILEAPPDDLKPDYQQATRLMLDRAYDQYGSILGAIINVRYSTSVEYYARGGKVDVNAQRMHTKATGTAICFVNRRNQCINPDDSESDEKPTAKSKPRSSQSEDDSLIQVEEDDVEKRPSISKIKSSEKLLIPGNILGNVLKEARTSSDYSKQIKGFKKAYEYEYGSFLIRIIEFKTALATASYLTSLSQQPNARKINIGFYWTTGQEKCTKCSNLAYLFDPTKVIAIYPEDQTLSTAVKVSIALEKK